MDSTLRPNGTARLDTPDGILSYYQSEEAGQLYTPPLEIETTTNIRPKVHRKMSVASSPSEYSPNTDEEPDPKSFQSPATATPATAKKQRPFASAPTSAGLRSRPSLPSVGGSDRRRLAMSSSEHGHGSVDSTSTTRHNSIRSRRGIERPMELVAPPDTSPKSYTQLTPPATAPLSANWGNPNASTISHHRSFSDITNSGGASTNSSSSNSTGHRRKPSRQVSIVGTNDGTSILPSPILEQAKQHQSPDLMHAPIFQLPQSRSSSPAMSQSDISDSRGSSSMSVHPPYPLVVTPDIGEGKNTRDALITTPTSPQTARPSRRSPSPTKLSARASSPGGESTSTTASSSGSSYPSPPFSPELPPSSFLYYQPGVHATAGPLPPPPRAAFNIVPGTTPPPRPPRLNSPPPKNRSRGNVGSVSQALQLPGSGASSLSGKTSNGSLSDVRSNSSKSVMSDHSEIIQSRSSPLSAASDNLPPIVTKIETNNPNHVREGAFPPSTSSVESSPVVHLKRRPTMGDLVADVDNAIDDVGLMKSSDLPPPTVVEPPRPSEECVPEFKRDNSWVNLAREDIPQAVTPTSDEGAAVSGDSGRGPIKIFRSSSSRSPPKQSQEMGDGSPSSSPRQLRSTLGANLKRFSSLPRTPSRKSEKRLSTSSRSSHTSSVSTVSTVPPPVPEVPVVPPTALTPPPIQKIITPWPAAMFYSEVLAKKTALERSLGYAAKINELYIHDCGLGEFLMDTRSRRRYPRKQAPLTPYGSRGPTTPNNLQPRHISRSSMESEATFPRRADTTTATDLGYRAPADSSPPHGPPALPYPSLALPSSSQTPLSSTNSSLSSASSVRFVVSPKPTKSSTGFFFSSLGRKGSTKTKDNNVPLSPTHTSKLQKIPSKTAPPNPRPVNISSAPTVPGGPRAATYRASRSQTIMLPKSPPSSADSHRSNSVNRRPSMFSTKRQSPDNTNAKLTGSLQEDPDFVSQVDKLVDLLPQADREVLAGYLRRAGSDLNAIGQYLEDEKNGTVRRD